ncbi:hypothetical protein EST38_g13561 [Candolleomyces aberdarensis]|uniref:SEC63 domain-containing protein n=1 Tax=Candolleomyces aberdarensis TaxID=2316362 RepID=A0A4Q2D1W9_9AGAR|nr:hypothetical protein EST38_g13561 [Candolleomyces aberdarensis]
MVNSAEPHLAKILACLSYVLEAKNASLMDGTLSPLLWMGFGCPIFRRRQPEKRPIDLINSLPASGSTEDQITRDIGAVATQHGRDLAHRSGGMGRRGLRNHLNSDDRAGAFRVLQIIERMTHLEIAEIYARLERTVVVGSWVDLPGACQALDQTPSANHPAHVGLASLAHFSECEAPAFDPYSTLGLPGALVQRIRYAKLLWCGRQWFSIYPKNNSLNSTSLYMLAASKHSKRRVEQQFGKLILFLSLPPGSDTATLCSAAQYGLAKRCSVSTIIRILARLDVELVLGVVVGVSRLAVLDLFTETFVQITKAYKLHPVTLSFIDQLILSLTDETIRKNWLGWNNPDSPQLTSMDIALVPWIVTAQNNSWVLSAYEEATTEEFVSALGKAFKWEIPESKDGQSAAAELDEIEKTILQKVGQQYAEVRKLTRDVDGEFHVSRRRALILIYAHLTRLPIKSASLQNEQRQILLQTPLLLNALLNVSAARNWLTPTLGIMRLNSYLAQALPPHAPPRVRLTQLPGVSKADIDSFTPRPREMTEVLSALEEKGDGRVGTVRKAISKWGRVEIVDAAFKVIGERVVTPSSIIFLVVKLRLTPPGSNTERKDVSVDEAKRIVQYNDKKDEEFLLSKQEAEDLPKGRSTGWAHAPHWPSNRKPTWWLVLGDEKQNRVVVPPIRISDIPYADTESDRDYRTYKIQFQGPPSTGVFTWKLFVVSDTFVAEEASKDLTLSIEHPPAADQDPSEDDISEPEEDSLAGQMAAMRGGPVKKRKDESDEESGTDDDESSGDDSSSDSDSD